MGSRLGWWLSGKVGRAVRRYVFREGGLMVVG